MLEIVTVKSQIVHVATILRQRGKLTGDVGRPTVDVGRPTVDAERPTVDVGKMTIDVGGLTLMRGDHMRKSTMLGGNNHRLWKFD